MPACFACLFQSQSSLFESSRPPDFAGFCTRESRSLTCLVLVVQFDPDLQTPLILGESLDFSDSEESQFVGVFSDGLWAKSEPVLSMSTFQKPATGAVLGMFLRLSRGVSPRV